MTTMFKNGSVVIANPACHGDGFVEAVITSITLIHFEYLPFT